MMIIGLTGGIGSGKTTVAKIFELLGIPVYYADDRAKLLMTQDVQLVAEMKQHFGEGAYNAVGELERKYIANIVFNDPAQLALLNSIVHPATIRDSITWANEQQAPYVMKEAALMFETEAFHHVHKVIGVSAPNALRIHRVMKRDNVTRNEVLARMHKQMDEAIKIKLCDYVIKNDEQQPVIEQVLDLHQKLLLLAKQ